MSELKQICKSKEEFIDSLEVNFSSIIENTLINNSNMNEVVNSLDTKFTELIIESILCNEEFKYGIQNIFFTKLNKATSNFTQVIHYLTNHYKVYPELKLMDQFTFNKKLIVAIVGIRSTLHSWRCEEDNDYLSKIREIKDSIISNL